MSYIIDLSGQWEVALETVNHKIPSHYTKTIYLPNTISDTGSALKTNQTNNICFTENKPFEGYAWYQKEISIPNQLSNLEIFLILERTRKTSLYLDYQFIGSENSLCVPHRYNLSGRLSAGFHTITILVDNTDILTNKNDSLNSFIPFNWNGIIGNLRLEFYPNIYISDIWLDTNISDSTVTINGCLHGASSAEAVVCVLPNISAKEIIRFYDTIQNPTMQSPISASTNSFSYDEHNFFKCQEIELDLSERWLPSKIFSIESQFSITYPLHDEADLWSEYTPAIHAISIHVKEDVHTLFFGLREFKSEQKNFTINGIPTYLRGKYDSLLFPSFAVPTTIKEWIEEMKLSKSYGINHYSFPFYPPLEAAFIAADLLGIYLEINIPFYEMPSKILKSFGNHPSFVMFSFNKNSYHYISCGQNLDSSYEVFNIALNDIQKKEPSTELDYDFISSLLCSQNDSIKEKTEERNLKVPIIGRRMEQFKFFPNFRELSKISISTQLKSIEFYKNRFKENKLSLLLTDYFKNSGKLIAECMKEEAEAFIRSRSIAGFQFLTLQDISGERVFFIDILNTLISKKGLISPEEWRTFCSDAVLFARFPKFNYCDSERFYAHIELSYFRGENFPYKKLHLSLGDQTMTVIIPPIEENHVDICDISLALPHVTAMTELHFDLVIEESDIRKSYSIWVYPKQCPFSELFSTDTITHSFTEAKERLKRGKCVLYLPKQEDMKRSLQGYYYMNSFYHSFCEYAASSSTVTSLLEEQSNSIGTMGLSIHNKHRSLKGFPCKTYSTKPWWNLIQHSRAIILDDLPKDYFPIVQTIDNFVRNHKLGTLFECKAETGKLLVCSIDFKSISDKPETKQLLSSLLQYITSEEFSPKETLELVELDKLFQ